MNKIIFSILIIFLILTILRFRIDNFSLETINLNPHLDLSDAVDDIVEDIYNNNKYLYNNIRKEILKTDKILEITGGTLTIDDLLFKTYSGDKFRI